MTARDEAIKAMDAEQECRLGEFVVFEETLGFLLDAVPADVLSRYLVERSTPIGPCPFCGGRNLVTDWIEVGGNDGLTHYVRGATCCIDCEAGSAPGAISL